MPNLPKETAGILDNVREPGALADLIASNFPQEHATVGDKQQILEAFDVKARVRLVLAMVGRQLEVLRVKKEISSMVQDEMGKIQREYILRQQMKTIREELGEGGDDDEIEELRERIRRAKLSAEVEKIAQEAALAPALDAAAVGRVQRHQDLPRVARRSAVVQDHRRQARASPTCAAASTRTTSASRR